MYFFSTTIKKSKGMIHTNFSKVVTSEGRGRRETRTRGFKGTRSLLLVKLGTKNIVFQFVVVI